MSLNLDRFRAIADKARAVAEPVRPITVSVRVRTWSGARIGAGTASVVDTEITPRPRVRELSLREVQSSGGHFEVGDIAVGPVTPPYTSNGGGGYTEAQLRPAGAPNKETLLVLSGDLDGEYRIVEIDTSRAVGFRIVARRLRTTP